MLQPRHKKLVDDLKITPFSLNYSQRTILNHYIRTPVAIIRGTLENAEDENNTSRTIKLSLEDYETILSELEELVKVVEKINEQSGQ